MREHIYVCMDLVLARTHTHTASWYMLMQNAAAWPKLSRAFTHLVHVAIVMGTLSLSSRSRGSGWKKLYMSL